ncbi:arabinogalactan endo-1,4-beta-galactosidase [Labilibaculum manganireducens]|uniref:Arabinogalactan endo-beta-1,4-galactanase n=1 Tax=Labilibaculum manganireducens TaxID=1940525 RepID=A0A2N3I6P7_9BACT|nr:glycosyl hydrolase 53 family protein [Labilibaculum manganireducens]PKQ65967.1 arabinogalactan endo-1,4-beta-galactosidase [Labilibaculum manganireducens]
MTMNVIKQSFALFLILLINQSCVSKGGNKESKNSDLAVKSVKEFVMGVDLSYVNQIEDFDGVYKEDGKAKDVYSIFKEHGANMVRLRIWNNPDWIYQVYGENSSLYSGFDDVKKSIRRAKAQGMAVNLDFHYSDTWADPGHQTVPKAWENITDINVLSDSVYQYTYSVLNELYKENLLPEMVQIGNETNCGLMHTDTNENFPKLSICDDNWTSLGKVLNAGIQAVRDIDAKTGKSTIVALHVADPKNLDFWYKGIINKAGVTGFDVAGFSYYPHWHTEVSFSDLPNVVKNLCADINKDVMILETAYPYTLEDVDSYTNIFGKESAIDGYPISVEGQRSFLIDLTQNMMDAGAKGVMYWEPAWISSNMKDLWGKGSGWDNATVFDSLGNLTNGIDYMSYDYKKNK